MGGGTPEDHENELIEGAEEVMEMGEDGPILPVVDPIEEVGPILPPQVEAHWATQKVRRTARKRRILSVSAVEFAEKWKSGLRSAKKLKKGGEGEGGGQGEDQ